MAYALPNAALAPDRSNRNDALKWTVGLSVLLHLAVGGIIVNQLISVPALEAEPEPIKVEIQPLERPKPPPPPPPQVIEDKQTPRVKPREALPVPEAPPMPPIELPPQPPSNAEPTVTSLPETVPAMAPKPTVRVPPKYPARAETREISGTATVQITVAPGGAVSDVQIVSETPTNYGFGDAAADAVWQWQFADAQPGTYRVTVKFRLD